MRFYFWQDIPNIHEAGYIKKLSDNGYECTVIFQRNIPTERLALGLTNPNYGGAKMIFCPVGTPLPDCVSKCSVNDYHFFTGIFAFDLTRRAFLELKNTDAKLVLISESRDIRGWRGVARYLHSWIFEGSIRRRIDFVFAMGEMGVKWFLKTGYERKKIFEFCYVVNENKDDFSLPLGANNAIKIAFVGALIDRKNPIILLESLRLIKSKNVIVDFVGVGDLAAEINKKSEEVLGVGRFNLLSLKNDQLQSYLNGVDILVLPSKWDGWGVVVNEALMSGCRVLVSARAGASTLVNEEIGLVFESGNKYDLANKLASLMRRGKVGSLERAEIKKFSRCISGDVVSRYILDILFKTSVEGRIAPWHRSEKPLNEKSTSIFLFYNFLPNYRAGIFDKLIEKYDVVFCAEDIERLEGIPAYSGRLPYVFLPVKARYLGRFRLHAGVLFAFLRSKAKFAFVLADPHFFATWLFAFAGVFLRKKVVFWTHGFLNQKRSISSLIKVFLFSCAYAVFLYGYRAKKIAIQFGLKSNRLFVGFNSLDYDRMLVLRNRLMIDRVGDDIGFNVLAISRLTKKSRYDILIRALGEVFKTSNEIFPVTIIGDGPDLIYLKSLSIECNVPVNFLGELYDENLVANYIFDSSVVVSPGKVGLTAVHSLMYGTPVISHSSFDNQMPEVECIVPDLTGQFFDYGSVSSLADAIIRAKNVFHDRLSVKLNCFAVVDEIYNPENQLNVVGQIVRGCPAAEGNDVDKLFAKI